MTINRHNYETYFLLYIDKELSVRDINALYLFLQENADLKTELDMLQGSVLQPEKISFTKKDGLLKKSNISQIQADSLMLFIDNELKPEQIKILQNELASYEQLSAELLILQQTKLTPDTNIIFKNKPSLYKKEKNRVIGFGWVKLAVAAIFIGFGVWGTSIYFNTNNNAGAGKTIAVLEVENGIEKRVSAPIPLKNNDVIVDKSIADKTTPSDKSATGLLQDEASATIAPGKTKMPVLTKDNFTVPKKINVKVPNSLNKPFVETIDRMDDEVVVKVTAAMQKINQNLPSFTNDNIKIESEKSINKTALYTNSIGDNDKKNNIDYFTLSEDEPKKNRLTGLLRKAKRILERTTNFENGDNNIKVANLAFTTH